MGEKLTREMLESVAREMMETPHYAPPITFSPAMFKAMWREAEIRGYRPATGRLGPLERRRMARELWAEIREGAKKPEARWRLW